MYYAISRPEPIEKSVIHIFRSLLNKKRLPHDDIMPTPEIVTIKIEFATHYTRIVVTNMYVYVYVINTLMRVNG